MTQDYFRLFGLPARFDIDAAELARRHRELIRQWHPDRFARGSDEERRVAVATSARLNDGLKVLRDPLERARHLLALNGVSTDEETDTVMDTAFLAEQLAWRERLEESGGDPEVAAALTSEVAACGADKQRALASALGEAADWAAARRLVRELQFLRRFERELDEARTGVS